MYSQAPCDFGFALLQMLSYQALMDAFTPLLAGRIKLWPPNETSLPADGAQRLSLYPRFQDNHHKHRDCAVRKSRLPHRFHRFAIWWRGAARVESTKNTLFNGLSNGREKERKLTLRESVEMLFQKFTVRLMISQQLQWVFTIATHLPMDAAAANQIAIPNKSSAFFPPKTKVTFSTNECIYLRSQPTLNGVRARHRPVRSARGRGPNRDMSQRFFLRQQLLEHLEAFSWGRTQRAHPRDIFGWEGSATGVFGECHGELSHEGGGGAESFAYTVAQEETGKPQGEGVGTETDFAKERDATIPLL